MILDLGYTSNVAGGSEWVRVGGGTLTFSSHITVSTSSGSF